MAGSRLPQGPRALFTLTSPEQELAFILQRVGPVVAIGKPGERLPELGAARVYVSHESWQQTVLEMLERSSLVLARVGASPGVLWELDRVLSLAERSKVVILILGSESDQAAGVRAIEERLGVPLPLPSAPASPSRLRIVLKLLWAIRSVRSACWSASTIAGAPWPTAFRRWSTGRAISSAR